jgi:hypothetical protein
MANSGASGLAKWSFMRNNLFMAKGAVLNMAFLDALGLSEHLLTLSRSILNKPHPVLLEPMFHIHTEEVDETIYLERQYLYDSQISIKPSYASGERILIWTYRARRYRSNDSENEAQDILLASDLFLLGDPHEFQRFRQFLKSKRIVDAQARDYLAHNYEKFPKMAEKSDGIDTIINCLANIQEWPDPENGFRTRTGDEHTLEGLAKRYSDALVAARSSSLFAEHLMHAQPDARLQVFRLLCYAEDRKAGPDGIITYLRDVAAATKMEPIIRRANRITNGRELSLAMEAIRRHLVNPGV